MNKRYKLSWWRRLYSLSVFSVLGLGTSIALAFVFFILFFMIIKGLMFFNISMLWKPFNTTNLLDGGMAPFIVTSLMLLFISLIFTIPISLFAAIYLTEYAKNRRIINWSNIFLNVLNAVPSVIFGIIGVTVFVLAFHAGYRGFSIFAGGLTLTLIVVPNLTIAMIEAINKVPKHLIQNSYAMGATQWQTISRIILPGSLQYMVGGLILTISRIIGESAPVYLTIGASVYMPNGFLDMGSSLVSEIYLLFTNPVGNNSVDFIYCLTFVVILLIFILNLVVRIGFWLWERAKFPNKGSRDKGVKHGKLMKTAIKKTV